MVPIRFAHNLRYKNPFFVIFAPFESPDSQLSNGATIMKKRIPVARVMNEWNREQLLSVFFRNNCTFL